MTTNSWPKIIASLEKSGYTQSDIASRCGIAQSAVSALKTGGRQDVLYASGVRLVALHKATIRKIHRAERRVNK